MLHGVLSLFALFLFGCSATGTESIVPSKDSKAGYKGDAIILIAVEGHGKRAVRHVRISTQKAKNGYAVFFHDKKPSKGFIVVKVHAPDSHVKLTEYSLSGYYGCSRGKRGYGYAIEEIPQVLPGKTYFLTTINTSMNTTYAQMPDALKQEARSHYHLARLPKEKNQEAYFKSTIVLSGE